MVVGIWWGMVMVAVDVDVDVVDGGGRGGRGGRSYWCGACLVADDL